MYACGMTTRTIQAQMQENFGVGGLPDAPLQCDRGGDGGGATVANLQPTLPIFTKPINQTAECEVVELILPREP